jgi:hypothetical protein
MDPEVRAALTTNQSVLDMELREAEKGQKAQIKSFLVNPDHVDWSNLNSNLGMEYLSTLENFSLILDDGQSCVLSEDAVARIIYAVSCGYGNYRLTGSGGYVARMSHCGVREVCLFAFVGWGGNPEDIGSVMESLNQEIQDSAGNILIYARVSCELTAELKTYLTKSGQFTIRNYGRGYQAIGFNVTLSSLQTEYMKAAYPITL